MTTLHFVRSGQKVRAVTVTLTYSVLQHILKLPKNTRLLHAIVAVKTAFSGGTTTLDVGISGSLESILKDVDVSSTGTTLPTTEFQQHGYKTTERTDIYLTVGSGNTAGEVDVTLLLALDTDIRM